MHDILLILGVGVLSVALRSFDHPALQKLGTLCVFGASFLTGFLLTGIWEVGLVCAGSWLLLPWLEILTRIRNLRIPREKLLRHRAEPSQETFPSLDALTSELEKEGFEQVDDIGWDGEDYTQFFRIFYKPGTSLQATISLIDQSDIAFYYLSISSRGKDGRIWTTWNYPFSYSRKPLPQLHLNRLRGDRTAAELLESHEQFLAKEGVSGELLTRSEPEGIQEEMERDLQAEIAHNLSAGLLLPDAEGKVRYSWRGMIFLWLQSLRDFVQLL